MDHYPIRSLINWIRHLMLAALISCLDNFVYANNTNEAVIFGRQTDVGGCTYGIIIREGMNELLRTADIVETNQEARYYFEVTGN